MERIMVMPLKIIVILLPPLLVGLNAERERERLLRAMVWRNNYWPVWKFREGGDKSILISFLIKNVILTH